MNRNNEEVKLFGNTYTLYERSAGDVLSLSEFVSKNTQGNTLGIAVYQSAIILEASLKLNQKELPKPYKDNFIKKFFRKFKESEKYNAYVKELTEKMEYNSTLKATYLLANLSQKELFDYVKKVYLLEGIDLDRKSNEDPTEKKS